MSGIFLPKELNLEKLTFNPEPKPMGDKGGKIIGITYDGKPLQVQIPLMATPFGVGVYEDTNTGIKKYDIQVSFREMETDEKMKAFFDFISGLDQKVLENASLAENSLKWFGKKKKMSKEVLDTLYTTTVKYPMVDGEKSDKYPPGFKMKLQTNKEGDFDFSAFDLTTKEKVGQNLVSLVTKGTRVKAIVRCSGMWVAGGKFGLSWQTVQLAVKPSQKLHNFAFRDEDDDEEHDEVHEEDATEKKEYVLEDSEDEEDNGL